MLVPNRHGSSNSYRYGFNGKEKDDELKGIGNSYDFGARMLDPRVGRWFAPDNAEKKYPDISTYSYCLNNPINLTDPDGNDPEPDPRVWFWWRKMILGTYAHLQLKAMSPTFVIRDWGDNWKAEYPIPFAGRADLVYTTFEGNVGVWELKPSSWETNPALSKIASNQINRYVNGIVKDKVANGETIFTVSTGTSGGGPLPFEGTITAPVSDGIYDYTATYYISNPTTGLIYYSLSEGVLKPELQKAAEISKTVAVITVVTGVVVAGVVAALPSGGTSLQGAYVAAAFLITATMMSQENNSNNNPNNTSSPQKNTEFKNENTPFKINTPDGKLRVDWQENGSKTNDNSKTNDDSKEVSSSPRYFNN